MIFIFGLIAVYLLGIAAAVAICGHMGGRKGDFPRFERPKDVNGRIHMTGWELLAGWSFVWPLCIPFGILAGGFACVAGTIELFIWIFESTHKQSFKVKERKDRLSQKELV